MPLQPTFKAVELFSTNGWSPEALENAGYTSEGQPTPAILQALRTAGSTDESLVASGLAVETEGTTINVNEKVEQFIAARDRKAELKDSIKAETAEMDERLVVLGGELGGFLEATGQTSGKADAGTFFFDTVYQVGMEDHQKFLDFMARNIAFHLMRAGVLHPTAQPNDVSEAMATFEGWAFYTKSLAKDTVKAYAEEHGEAPPGVKLERIRDVKVRKAPAKKK